jgi:signal transduction histidine kinase
MTGVVATLDDYGKPAWIAVMVAGFILFWPVGLAILGYLLWSGRMGCGARNGEMSRWQQRWADRWDRKVERFGREFRGSFASSGNAAFDEYREETLRRLEEEQREFREFLERLRKAKDKSEFDQFMADRRNQPTTGTQDATT